MKRMLTVLALLLLLPVSAAQDDVDPMDNATQAVDSLLEPPEDLGVTDLLEDTGGSIEDGAADLGDLIGRAVAAVGRALSATAGALMSVGAATAIGLGSFTLLAGEGTGHLIIAVGSLGGGVAALVGSGLAAAATGIGSAFAFIGTAYTDLVRGLRPDAMPPVAFGAVVATGAAGSAGVSGWAGWNVLKKWGWVAGGLPGMAGFTRIQNDQLLEHPVRNQIFSMIQENPGIHASHLAREVGVGWGTVSHHLDKLQKGQMVTTRKVNNQNCYFEQGGSVSRAEMEVASAVKGDTAGRIASFVHAHPMTSQKVLAEALGISPALASFHAKKLVNLGVLDKMRHGKETLLTTSQAMHRLLESDRNLAAAMAGREEEHLDYSA